MKPTTIVAALLTLSLPFTACSSETDESQATPDESVKQTACRAYLLGVAGSDQGAARLMRDGLVYSTYEPDSILRLLDDVYQAALDAGRTAGLADSDFDLFEDVATQVGLSRAAVDSGGLTRASTTAFERSINATREACA